MSQKLSSECFRSAFKVVDKDLLRWFPGHMGKGLKQMQQKLKSVDCIVEVHDARIPISGKNTDFKQTVSGIKPHILVLNKEDLIEKKYKDRIVNKLKNEYENVVFTNCKNERCKGVAKIFPLAKELIKNADRYNRTGADDYCMMIIGVPNVGKSSLINMLRIQNLHKGKASPVGAQPGITKSVMHKIKMSENPLFYMLDTPGILTPNITNIESGLKLALCATIQDHFVGERIIVDYLLYWLNSHQYFSYVDYFKLEKPSDNILEVLSHISVTHNRMLKIRNHLNEYVMKPNFDAAAQIMIKTFRSGSLGKYILDEKLL
ncbi:unnamed protein product [Brassicogethes aeneus]|uniref:Mitochondrial GTPase 1 n=1 Tax=Brassicogethes aeneus TaxID=1431903 RepID=A0A9P0AUM5_BRAAE|nr:unnamed protein product [Brassicogethes aeneus]